MSQSNQSILVVEDNTDLLNLIKINLHDQGYNVVTAVDGEKALEVYKTEAPSLLILDIMMPENSCQFF